MVLRIIIVVCFVHLVPYLVPPAAAVLTACAGSTCSSVEQCVPDNCERHSSALLWDAFFHNVTSINGFGAPKLTRHAAVALGDAVILYIGGLEEANGIVRSERRASATVWAYWVATDEWTHALGPLSPWTTDAEGSVGWTAGPDGSAETTSATNDSAIGPAARWDASIVAISDRAALLYGGVCCGDTVLSDAWVILWNGVTVGAGQSAFEWVGPINITEDALHGKPVARAGASLVRDVKAQKLWLFGGSRAGSSYASADAPSAPLLSDLWSISLPSAAVISQLATWYGVAARQLFARAAAALADGLPLPDGMPPATPVLQWSAVSRTAGAAWPSSRAFHSAVMEYRDCDCCDPRHGSGCNNATIEACVCAANPVCCSSSWSGATTSPYPGGGAVGKASEWDACVALVASAGCGQCPCTTSDVLVVVSGAVGLLGESADDLWQFDPYTLKWSEIEPLNTPLQQRPRNPHIFEVGTDESWLPAVPTVPRQRLRCVFHHNRTLCIGGMDAYTLHVPDMIEYDRYQHRWYEALFRFGMPNMNQGLVNHLPPALHGHSLTVCNDRLFILGGSIGAHGPIPTPFADSYGDFWPSDATAGRLPRDLVFYSWFISTGYHRPECPVGWYSIDGLGEGIQTPNPSDVPCFSTSNDIFHQGAVGMEYNTNPAGHSYNSHCFICPKGEVSKKGSYWCTPCNGWGDFVDGKGVYAYPEWGFASQCLSCPAGTFSLNSSSHYGQIGYCAQSSNGYDCLDLSIVPDRSMAFCRPCPLGMFSTTTGGTATIADNLDGETCPGSCCSQFMLDYTLIQHQSCQYCSAGQYGPAFGATSCVKCPGGTHNNFQGRTALSDCLDCAPGYYSESGWNLCQQCLLGTATANTRSAYCPDCPIGSYADTIGSTTCTECLRGHYSITSKAESISACLECPKGSYQPLSGQQFCNSCPAGSYNELTGRWECDLCPIGTYSEEIRAEVYPCKPCPPGTYNDEPGQSSCTPCPAATYRSETGGTAVSDCTVCPAGRYGPVNVTGLIAYTDCPLCERGHWAPEFSQRCFECRPGTYLPDYGGVNWTQCLPCKQVYYSAAGAGECTVCPDGSYSFSGWPECYNCSTKGNPVPVSGLVNDGSADVTWDASNLDDADNPELFSWSASAGSATAKMTRDSSVFNVAARDTPPYGSWRVDQPSSPSSVYSSFYQIIGVGRDGILNAPPFRSSAWVYVDPSFSISGVQSSGGVADDGTVSPSVSRELSVTWTYMIANTTDSQGFPLASSVAGSRTRVIRTMDFRGIQRGTWTLLEDIYTPLGNFTSMLAEILLEVHVRGYPSQSVWFDDFSVVPNPDEVCVCVEQGNLYGTYYNASMKDSMTGNSCQHCDATYACYGGVRTRCHGDEYAHGGSTSCMPCPKGWRCTFEFSTPCDTGYYIDEATNTCNPCPLGSICGRKVLEGCAPGSYSDAGEVCIPCLPGFYSNTSNAWWCWTCPPGTQSNYMRDGCEACPGGHYSALGLRCESCPTGTFSVEEGSSFCLSCFESSTNTYSMTVRRNDPPNGILLRPLTCELGDVEPRLINVPQPKLGVAIFNRFDGRSVTYRPHQGVVGADQFTAVIEYGNGVQQTAIVNVLITNTPPRPADDYISVSATAPTVVMTITDNDADDESDAIYIQSIDWFYGDPSVLSVFWSIEDPGLLRVTLLDTTAHSYIKGYVMVNDSHMASTTRSILTICAGCTPPVAVNDTLDVPQGATRTLYVLANDYDSDGDTIVVNRVIPLLAGNVTAYGRSAVTSGVLSISASGDAVVYTAVEYTCGNDTFAYEVASHDGVAIGYVHVMLTNCLCFYPVDLVFVIDGTPDVSDDDFVRTMALMESVSLRLYFAGSAGPRMAIYSLGQRLPLAYETLSSDRAGITSRIRALLPLRDPAAIRSVNESLFLAASELSRDVRDMATSFSAVRSFASTSHRLSVTVPLSRLLPEYTHPAET